MSVHNFRRKVIKVKDLRALIEKSLDESKALEVVVIDLKNKTDIADFMIIASGTSSRHVNAISERLLEELRHCGVKGISPEGAESAEWIVIDAYDIIAHIFKPETRAHYELEKMWQMPVEKVVERRKRKVK